MSEIPQYHEFFQPTLLALHNLGGSGTNQEIYDQICTTQNYSEVLQSHLHKDGPQTELSYRMAWARTYLKKYGLIENLGRGVWSLTPTGKQTQTLNPREVQKFVRARSLNTQNESETVSLDDPETDEMPNPERLGFPLTSERWSEVLLTILQTMSPAQFERLCQLLLRRSGFIKVEVTGRSGDEGIDGIGVLKIALLSFQVLFQCKRYKGSVGAAEIRDFRGAMVGRTDKGIFLTTGTFTRSAEQEASRDGAPAIDLIDGAQLCTLLQELGLGVRTKTVEVLEIQHTWFEQL